MIRCMNSLIDPFSLQRWYPHCVLCVVMIRPNIRSIGRWHKRSPTVCLFPVRRTYGIIPSVFSGEVISVRYVSVFLFFFPSFISIFILFIIIIDNDHDHQSI